MPDTCPRRLQFTNCQLNRTGASKQLWATNLILTNRGPATRPLSESREINSDIYAPSPPKINGVQNARSPPPLAISPITKYASANARRVKYREIPLFLPQYNSRNQYLAATHAIRQLPTGYNRCGHTAWALSSTREINSFRYAPDLARIHGIQNARRPPLYLCARK